MANKIKPINEPGACRTGGLANTLTVGDITKVLGFKPNVDDDPDKVKYSWGFTYMGAKCGIWDYKGSRWSTYGPDVVFESLFPGQVKK